MATAVRRSPPRTQPQPKVAGGYRGAEGLRKMKEEEARAAARKEAAQMNSRMPFRFKIMESELGQPRQIVVVDHEPDFFRFEHNLKNTRTNRWDIYCECIAENANCPVCKATDRPAYFGMFLTIIDLTPYENKDGETIEWSKKLLVVKSAQQKKFTRLLDAHGTLRGMILDMTRDGEKDASIGNDIQFVGFMEEAELEQYVTEYEYEKDGRKQTVEVLGYEPFDYDDLFPRPTEQQLRAIVGGRPEPGSRDEAEEEGVRRRPAARGRNEDWDDRGRPPARSRPARQIDPDDNPEQGTEPEAEAEESPPSRGAPARRTAPTTARPAVRRAAPAEAEVEEEPPQRAVRRTAREEPEEPAQRPPIRRASTPVRGRAPQPDPEAEQPETEEEAPRRTAASLADRRRALRR